LTTGLVVGPRMIEMVQNFAGNLREGRVRLVMGWQRRARRVEIMGFSASVTILPNVLEKLWAGCRMICVVWPMGSGFLSLRNVARLSVTRRNVSSALAPWVMTGGKADLDNEPAVDREFSSWPDGVEKSWGR
jgi:hypothetical protein